MTVLVDSWAWIEYFHGSSVRVNEVATIIEKHEMKWGLGDSIIYATAKREGAMVLTGDPHFKGMKDVIFLGR